MTDAPLGTYDWVAATGGQLTAAERWSLLRPLAAAQAATVIGRLAVLTRLNSGRRAAIDLADVRPPTSALAAAAEREARSRLSPALMHHSFRTYTFGAALGALTGIDVDQEVLFVAAMLHDVGLRPPKRDVDFTLASARVAGDVAGLRSGALPPHLLDQTVRQWPRVGFKREFRTAWRAEAAAVPRGRAKLLRRYGAFGPAIACAPFRG